LFGIIKTLKLEISKKQMGSFKNKRKLIEKLQVAISGQGDNCGYLFDCVHLK